MEPGLTICSSPNDFAPGSCAMINVARMIDAYEALRTWARIQIAVCKVPER